MTTAKNSAEEVVARIARGSFLALWSYANPQGKHGKELCDVLAVCDPDLVIFSVKDIAVGQSGNIQTDWQRWQRAAIDESCKQIYGAERWLSTAQRVIRADGSPGISLPPLGDRRIHRIAIALGSKGRVPVYMGDFGKGFVHVLSDTSLTAVLGELDTVHDLCAYLLAKEDLFARGVQIVSDGDEQDLLALYLQGGRRMPTATDSIVVARGTWDTFVERPEVQARKAADKKSYAWDWLVDYLAQHVLHGRLEFGHDLDQNELCIRTMAREDRFARRILGESFTDFVEASRAGLRTTVRSRMCLSPSGTVYVFLATPHGEPRDLRVAELQMRCEVARGLNPESTTVIGIAQEKYEIDRGFSLDVAYVHIPEWTAHWQERLENLQRELGYFVNPRVQHDGVDEYPRPEGTASS